MENIFGIETEIVEKALKNSIKVKKDGKFVDITGFVSLTYIPQYSKFILAYGSSATDAGWVYVDKYEKDWIIK